MSSEFLFINKLIQNSRKPFQFQHIILFFQHGKISANRNETYDIRNAFIHEIDEKLRNFLSQIFLKHIHKYEYTKQYI